MRGDVVPDTGDYPRPVIDPSTLSGSNSRACLTTLNSSNQVYEDLVFSQWCGHVREPTLGGDGRHP